MSTDNLPSTNLPPREPWWWLAGRWLLALPLLVVALAVGGAICWGLLGTLAGWVGVALGASVRGWTGTTGIPGAALAVAATCALTLHVAGSLHWHWFQVARWRLAYYLLAAGPVSASAAGVFFGIVTPDLGRWAGLAAGAGVGIYLALLRFPEAPPEPFTPEEIPPEERWLERYPHVVGAVVVACLAGGAATAYGVGLYREGIGLGIGGSVALGVAYLVVAGFLATVAEFFFSWNNAAVADVAVKRIAKTLGYGAMVAGASWGCLDEGPWGLLGGALAGWFLGTLAQWALLVVALSFPARHCLPLLAPVNRLLLLAGIGVLAHDGAQLLNVAAALPLGGLGSALRSTTGPSVSRQDLQDAVIWPRLGLAGFAGRPMRLLLTDDARKTTQVGLYLTEVIQGDTKLRQLPEEWRATLADASLSAVLANKNLVIKTLADPLLAATGIALDRIAEEQARRALERPWLVRAARWIDRETQRKEPS